MDITDLEERPSLVNSSQPNSLIDSEHGYLRRPLRSRGLIETPYRRPEHRLSSPPHKARNGEVAIPNPSFYLETLGFECLLDNFTHDSVVLPPPFFGHIDQIASRHPEEFRQG